MKQIPTSDFFFLLIPIDGQVPCDFQLPTPIQRVFTLYRKVVPYGKSWIEPTYHSKRVQTLKNEWTTQPLHWR